ncbi:hypothetical protein [Streptomyces sp. YPW6]|uniref:hypothetical protein n=1 Tax=Streptomyces sp. YPW6 TaxID=2840373 RepID=UPI003D7418AE
MTPGAVCTYITVQAHRLDPPLQLGELAEDLDRAGFPLVEVAPDGVGCRRFVRADSQVGVLVDEENGQVLAMTAPAWFAPGPRGEPSPWPRAAGRDRARHLVGLGAAERETWARRRQPEEAGEAARRWWFLWVSCRQLLPGDGERRYGHGHAAWQELGLWLLGSCEAAGALDRRSCGTGCSPRTRPYGPAWTPSRCPGRTWRPGSRPRTHGRT